MTIVNNLYDTNTLLGVYKDIPAPSNYWLTLGFPATVTSTDEYIDFEKIIEYRKLAPFVVPTVQGRPIYTEATKLTRYKPAYLKPKDVINPNRLMKRSAGEMFINTPMTPQMRFDATVANIMRLHRDAIERRWEWMAAQAILNGTITISDESYPSAVIDFGRDAGFTITLGSGAYWDDPDADILGTIEGWRTSMRQIRFGGPTDRLTVGPDAWDAMRKNNGIRKQLEVFMRGTTADINTGVLDGNSVEFVGKLSETLSVYVYSDYYEAPDGTVTPFMDTRDVVLSGPNIQGVRAFGAILDQRASFAPTPVFPKMWNQEDPSATFIMTQSAPLMIPVNPNNTLRARVLA